MGLLGIWLTMMNLMQDACAIKHTHIFPTTRNDAIDPTNTTTHTETLPKSQSQADNIANGRVGGWDSFNHPGASWAAKFFFSTDSEHKRHLLQSGLRG
jgi:hypothetical protein